MITKKQALTAQMFHYGRCTRRIGPRGRITEHSQCWRRNGVTQTWVTRPDEFRVPIEHGLKSCAQLRECDAGSFHTAEDCPLNDPAYVTTDLRPKK